jgi:hypothetical protein
VSVDKPIPYRVTLTGTIYARAIRLSQSQNQVVGEKGDYYITLQQLESILEKVGTTGTPNAQPGSSSSLPRP